MQFDKQLEIEIIKMMIDDKKSLPILATTIQANHFYDKVHADNFQKLVEDYVEFGEIDLTKIKKISNYLDHTHYNSSSFAKQFSDRLVNLWKLRELEFLKLQKLGDNADDYISKAVDEFAKLQGASDSGDSDIKEISTKAFDKWCEIGDGLLGQETGVKPFDDLVSGYCEGHYWVIGAYTNYGKTTLACYMTAQYLKIHKEKHIAFFSVEMTRHQIYERIIAQHAKTGIKRIRFNPNQYTEHIEALHNSKLHIFDSDRSVESIKLRLTSLKAKGELPRLVFIDFLQNIQGQGSEYENMSATTLAFQSLALDLGITIIALSQVSNESVKTKSKVIQFKGAGTIAASADVGIIINRDKDVEIEEDLEVAELDAIMMKNRHGRTAAIKFYLNLKSGILTCANE